MGNNKIQKNKNTIKAAVEVLIIKEGRTYVAYCPALELSSYGETERRALQAFGSALDIFFEETRRKGTLEKTLLKLGWSLRQQPQPMYEPPKIASADLLRMFKSNTKSVRTEVIAVPA